MEINKEIFEKYNKFDINNIPDIEDDFIGKLVEAQSKQIDKMYCEFLEENGYKIDKPYNIEQLKQIKADLEKQDKFVDCLEYTEFADNCTQAYHYVIPFFNSISNPLSEETRNKVIEKWKEKNRKNRKDK